MNQVRLPYRFPGGGRQTQRPAIPAKGVNITSVHRGSRSWPAIVTGRTAVLVFPDHAAVIGAEAIDHVLAIDVAAGVDFAARHRDARPALANLNRPNLARAACGPSVV